MGRGGLSWFSLVVRAQRPSVSGESAYFSVDHSKEAHQHWDREAWAGTPLPQRPSVGSLGHTILHLWDWYCFFPLSEVSTRAVTLSRMFSMTVTALSLAGGYQVFIYFNFKLFVQNTLLILKTWIRVWTVRLCRQITQKFKRICFVF